MVLGGVVVDLVDWHGSVNDVRLDGLTVDNRLDLLMDVVVDVLTSNGWGGGRSVLGVATDGGVLELGSLSLKTSLNILGAVVLELTVLDSTKVVVVLLRENLFVDDWLD